jgi:hypothetical protein
MFEASENHLFHETFDKCFAQTPLVKTKKHATPTKEQLLEVFSDIVWKTIGLVAVMPTLSECSVSSFFLGP